MPHRKILENHAYLRVLADRLRVLCDAPTDALSATRWQKLMDHELRGLADTLAEHFAVEESGGYLKGVLAAHPELAARAGDFVEQHRSMKASAEGLLAALAGGAGIERLRGPVKTLLASMAAHEAAETEMIQHALMQDTGAGD